MTANSLKINLDKTEVLAITTIVNPWSDLFWPHELGSYPEPATTVKSLGIKIDAKLSMSPQIATVVGTCIGILRQLRKLAPLLSFSTLRRVVSALILSRLDYGNSLYIGLPATLLSRLQIIMNDAARLIFKVPRCTHATPLLRQLHWLPIKQRIKFKGLCIAHKAIYGQVPSYIKERLANYTPGRVLHSSEASLLSCPRFNRATMGGRAFSVTIPHLWNSLPVHLRKEQALLPFRKQIKTVLFLEG